VLLPYHSHVDPPTVVRALNRMVEDVNEGEQIFFDFSADSAKTGQPAQSNTGLFFFRGKPGAPFAIISPGGGFSYVGSLHEGFPYAVEISRHGYNAFVLRYRAGHGGTAATRDLAAALSYVFRNATALGVGPRAIRCGAVRLAHAWRQRSARTGLRTSEATPCPSHRRW